MSERNVRKINFVDTAAAGFNKVAGMLRGDREEFWSKYYNVDKEDLVDKMSEQIVIIENYLFEDNTKKSGKDEIIIRETFDMKGSFVDLRSIMSAEEFKDSVMEMLDSKDFGDLIRAFRCNGGEIISEKNGEFDYVRKFGAPPLKDIFETLRILKTLNKDVDLIMDKKKAKKNRRLEEETELERAINRLLNRD